MLMEIAELYVEQESENP